MQLIATWCLIIANLALLVSYSNAQYSYVKTNSGSVFGRQSVTATGKVFYAYKGIPYAEPPINELRFQAPVPKKPWSGNYDATREKGYCFQMNRDNNLETEDCLYIHVYTPAKPSSNASLPVLFFIYGGGFIEGYAVENTYGPHHLMEHDVIMVSFNYRVGPFGFFSLGDTVVPGNAGLKDQHLALLWTNQNIKYFGGDPNKITIVGHSAGSASVAYHILSPMSKGLFRAAIMESGSALSPWAYQRNLIGLSKQVASYINAQEYARHNSSSRSLYGYLKTVPARDIDKASQVLMKKQSPHNIQLQQGFFFTPTLEVEHSGAFLTQRMYDLFSQGNFNKVPVIIGVNSEEAYYYNDDIHFAKTTSAFDNEIELLLPLDMNIKPENRRQAANTIKQFYSPKQTFSQNPRNLIKYFSDQSFARSLVMQAHLQSKYTPVWMYQFSYHGQLGGHASKSESGFSDKVRHGEELCYIYSRNFPSHKTIDLSKYPPMDVTVHQRFITLFTNFAKYLNPTPRQDQLLEKIIWPRVDNTFKYLDIGSSMLLRQHPKLQMFQMWLKIYSQYGVPPYITY